MKMKMARPPCKRVNVSVPPEILIEWDRRAKELNTTRSGLITMMMQITEAFSSNRRMKRTFETIIGGALRREMKKITK